MIVVLAITLAALALRLVVADALPLIDTDGVAYVTIARQFQETGSPYHPLYHPLYPICIALAQQFVGDWETAGRLVSALFGALVILPAFVVARAVVACQSAIIAAVLIAVHPWPVLNSSPLPCDSTHTFLLLRGGLAGRRGR